MIGPFTLSIFYFFSFFKGQFFFFFFFLLEKRFGIFLQISSFLMKTSLHFSVPKEFQIFTSKN